MSRNFVTPARAGLLVASIALGYGLAGLSTHGLTVDASSLFYAGDRTLFWASHPKAEKAMDLWAPDPPGFHSDFNRTYSVSGDPVHFPVLPDLIAAISGKIFNGTLRWMSNLDAHLLGLVALHAFALVIFGYYAVALLGPAAGLAAALSYALFPVMLGHAFNNPKDSPCADFYGCALLAAGVGVTKGRAGTVWIASLLLGLSFSCKFNAVFALLTFWAWLPITFLWLYRDRRPVAVPLVTAVWAMPIVAGLSFFLLWPWLYEGDVPSWINHTSDYLSFMVSRGSSERPTWTSYSLRCLIFMTPPVVLLAAGLGTASVWWARDRARLATWALLVLWTGIPLLRVAVPYSDFYDGNRHFLEYIPGLCCLAGVGAEELGRWLQRRWPARWGSPHVAIIAFGALAIVFLLLPLAVYRPYETTYFNFLTGGLGGAQRRALLRVPPPHPDWVNGTEGDYWFNSLRNALFQLAQVAPEPIEVGLCGAWPEHALLDWPVVKPFQFELFSDHRAAPYVYASPRESFCSWDTIGELERSRPVLYREERGGGLIYELFGPKADHLLPARSKPTAYNHEGK
jgi:hypothetical protein